jgi:hypothetical protein
MVTVTYEEVVAVAPEFATLAETVEGQEQIDEMITLARQFVSEDKWGTGTKTVKAISLCAAHFLKTLGFGSGGVSTTAAGPVTREKVGDLERTSGNYGNFDSGSHVFRNLIWPNIRAPEKNDSYNPHGGLMKIEPGTEYRNSEVKFNSCGGCAFCRNLKNFTDGNTYVVKGAEAGKPSFLHLKNDAGVPVRVKSCHFSRVR